jgi:hypothetical protein
MSFLLLCGLPGAHPGRPYPRCSPPKQDRRLLDNRRDNAAAARDAITLRYGWA